MIVHPNSNERFIVEARKSSHKTFYFERPSFLKTHLFPIMIGIIFPLVIYFFDKVVLTIRIATYITSFFGTWLNLPIPEDVPMWSIANLFLLISFIFIVFFIEIKNYRLRKN